jgi:hypothetical protein
MQQMLNTDAFSNPGQVPANETMSVINSYRVASSRNSAVAFLLLLTTTTILVVNDDDNNPFSFVTEIVLM